MHTNKYIKSRIKYVRIQQNSRQASSLNIAYFLDNYTINHILFQVAVRMVCTYVCLYNTSQAENRLNPLAL